MNISPTKSGYLAIVGIKDFQVKESNMGITGRQDPFLADPVHGMVL